MRKTANILLILTALAGGLEALIGYLDILSLSESTERWIMIFWVFIVGVIQAATNWKSGQEIKELKREKLR